MKVESKSDIIFVRIFCLRLAWSFKIIDFLCDEETIMKPFFFQNQEQEEKIDLLAKLLHNIAT